MNKLLSLLLLPARYHFYGSLAIVLLVSAAISGQMLDRQSFANSELHRDVMDRWGAPIVQPSPSVRYVPSGAVFNTLSPLPLQSQEVVVDAAMNYRKRGLVYFSGFDFTFPDDKGSAAPRAELVVDNIGRELMSWIEASKGGRGAEVRLMIVLRETPDVIEADYRLGLERIVVDQWKISGELGYGNLLDLPAVAVRYDPSTAPGLF